VPALVNPGVSKRSAGAPASACSTRFHRRPLARWFPRLALRGSQSRQLRLGRVQLVEAAVGVEFVLRDGAGDLITVEIGLAVFVAV